MPYFSSSFSHTSLRLGKAGTACASCESGISALTAIFFYFMVIRKPRTPLPIEA